MKKLAIIITLAMVAAPATAERFGAGIDVHDVSGWGQSQGSDYTPSNPSPDRGGAYDGNDGTRTGTRHIQFLNGISIPDIQNFPRSWSFPWTRN